MNAYLTDNLWLQTARAANTNCSRLAKGLGDLPNVTISNKPQANIIFADMSRATHQRLHAAGAEYYVLAGDHTKGAPDEMLPARLVCDWSITAAQIDRFLSLAKG
jgi:threonine aldolase